MTTSRFVAALWAVACCAVAFSQSKYSVSIFFGGVVAVVLFDALCSSIKESK